MRKKIVIIVMLCCFCLANATDYYVDATLGSDTNSGLSSANPWQSLSKVTSFTFSPGDRLYFKAGEVWNGQLQLKGSGTNGNPIILNMYGTGNKPIINGGGALTNSAATVLLKNVEYWEINNLELTNTNGNSDYQGDLWAILGELDIAGGMEAHHIYIRDCYIHDVNGDVATKTTGGIYMTAFATSPSRYNDLRIENNVIDNVGGLGIANQSSHASITSGSRYPSLNIIIRGNIVSNTGRNNMIIRASDGSLVEHNTLINSSRYDSGHSIFCFNTESVIMQYNETYGNKGPGNKDRGAYDADYNCKNTVIQYNFSHDNHWGFAVMKRAINENVVIRYNISENDDKAIYFYGFEGNTGMTKASFYNNTHYIKSGIQLSVFGSGGTGRTAFNTDFYNNIFYFVDAGSDWGSIGSLVDFKNNCFYNITPQGTSYLTSDPLFVNPDTGEQDIDWTNYPNVLTGYKLQVGSPAINMGTEIANNGGQDFWGNLLYNSIPDIGAFELPLDTTNNIPTDITLSSNSIEENNAPDAVLGTLISVDADVSDNSYFNLIEGDGDDDNNVFSINGNQLLVNSPLDFETQPNLSLRIRTTDGRGGSFDKLFNISVVDQEPESMITLSAIDDAFVRGGAHTNTNYGTSPELNVKQASLDFTRESYLKFDLSSLTGSSINNAKLVLTPSNAGANAALTQVEVKSVSDDTWTENTITYNNKPVQGSVLASKPGSPDPMEWNVTSQVISELAGDGKLSLALTSSVAGSNHFVTYNSKEVSTASFRPTLLVSLTNGSTINKDVFLIIGQSNTAGRGEIESKDEPILSNVHLLNGEDMWELAENPLNKHSTIRKDLNFQKLSYAYTFGKLMEESISKDIGLVVNARGGTNINDWQKGASANYYGEALTRLQTALSIPGSTLKGILWHQGESNRNDGAAYITKLESIINDFRADLGVSDLPFIAGELSYDRPENSNFNTILATLPVQVSNTTYVSAEFLHTTDLTHFDSEAQRVLGGRYTSKMLELAYGFTTETQVVWVDEDVYVRGGTYADTNYNSESVLRVKSVADQNSTRESYLKFDLSSIDSQIIDAILVVNGSEPDDSNLMPTYFETSDSWTETTMTWNNKPTDGNQLEIVPVASNTLTNYEVFLSEYAQETQNGDGVLSVSIKDSGLTGGQFRFTSKEDISNQQIRPYLLVTTLGESTLSNGSLKEEINSVRHISIYPNPGSQYIFFRNIEEVDKIQIIDINGKRILENIDLSSVKDSGLSLSTFQKGIYFVRFFINNRDLITKKLLVY